MQATRSRFGPMQGPQPTVIKMELVDFGKGATSALTEEPQSMPIPMMPGQ